MNQGTRSTTPSRFRNLVINVALTIVVLVAGLAGLEFVSRWILPTPPGTQFLDAAGRPARLFDDPNKLNANVTFRQLSPDFDVLSHTGPRGTRAPEPSSSADVVFLGDSFTFGQGLADEDTIPARYAAATGTTVANVSRPGTGTHIQVRMLEARLAEGWRPREVKLVMFAMASAVLAGNDFLDTQIEVEDERRATVGARTVGADTGDATLEAEGGGLLTPLLRNRHAILATSNLARIVYERLGPTLRTWASPDSPRHRLDDGITAVSAELKRLSALGVEHGFRVTVYVIHPVQDLTRGTYRDTDAAVALAAGGLPIIDTAPALLDHPTSYYFPYDGHLNASGAARVAAVIAQHDESTP